MLILLTAATFLKFYIELWQTFARSEPVAQCWLLPATSALCLKKKHCGPSVKLNLLSPVFIQVSALCFESNASLFPTNTRPVCFSTFLGFSHWLQRHLFRVFTSLDANCHHIDASLKHAIELGVISAMQIFASCIDQAGLFMEIYNF